VNVAEAFQGRPAWTGTVEVFVLDGHSEADRCYAWGSATDSGKVRTYAVLGKPPINSATAAVRASIAADFKAGRA